MTHVFPRQALRRRRSAATMAGPAALFRPSDRARGRRPAGGVDVLGADLSVNQSKAKPAGLSEYIHNVHICTYMYICIHT